jgi:hypothetical protein
MSGQHGKVSGEVRHSHEPTRSRRRVRIPAPGELAAGVGVMHRAAERVAADIATSLARTPGSSSSSPATVIRVDIQPRNGHQRRQRGRQQQLCVPLVPTDGESYRMREARAKGDTTRKKR